MKIEHEDAILNKLDLISERINNLEISKYKLSLDINIKIGKYMTQYLKLFKKLGKRKESDRNY